jgi:hypothetical protein
VEVRQFPHVARAFNLTAEQLHTRVVGRWVRDQTIELDQRRWAPERAKLKIYEAPQLVSSELGLGRGWSNVTRAGEDVTDRVLAAARSGLQGGAGVPSPAPGVAALKRRLFEELARGPVQLSRVPELTSELPLGARASQRLAVAEQAVWELLHEGTAGASDETGPIPPERWESVLLAWNSWDAGVHVILQRVSD